MSIWSDFPEIDNKDTSVWIPLSRTSFAQETSSSGILYFLRNASRVQFGMTCVNLLYFSMYLEIYVLQMLLSILSQLQYFSVKFIILRSTYNCFQFSIRDFSAEVRDTVSYIFHYYISIIELITLLETCLNIQYPFYNQYSMCYLPVGCLNIIIGIGAFSSIGVSLGLLALTVYANLEKKDIIDNTAAKIINDYLIGLYMASTAFMMLGICGIYSCMKSKKSSGRCWLHLYGFGVTIFFFVFAGSSVFFFIGPQTIFRDDCTAGSTVQLVDDLYALNNKAINKFCRVGCECYVSDKAEGAAEFKQFAKNNNFTLSIDTAKVNYQSCLSDRQKQDPNLELMKAIENIFECSGWCENEPLKFNRFSDINNCLATSCLSTRENCYNKFESFLKAEGRLVGFGCSAATALCLINLLTICCIYCHPSRSRNKNFYQKMKEN